MLGGGLRAWGDLAEIVMTLDFWTLKSELGNPYDNGNRCRYGYGCRCGDRFGSGSGSKIYEFKASAYGFKGYGFNVYRSRVDGFKVYGFKMWDQRVRGKHMHVYCSSNSGL